MSSGELYKNQKEVVDVRQTTSKSFAVSLRGLLHLAGQRLGRRQECGWVKGG